MYIALHLIINANYTVRKFTKVDLLMRPGCRKDSVVRSSLIGQLELILSAFTNQEAFNTLPLLPLCVEWKC
jgi:hypothetical protein